MKHSQQFQPLGHRMVIDMSPKIETSGYNKKKYIKNTMNIANAFNRWDIDMPPKSETSGYRQRI
jgi:hypothetical protein